ncbi:ketoacyl-synt-domain-containing protein [Aspergillus japonicus CBS 114.51]|uniref:Ketoacyl-synt-domain-containing protein n=1 Tax=Aspergillus japonicus CBS 114.51 TaxID=1448312 RepID=A0A8T8X257_ASPJA|nr:ketoacyl-synt-domain-containing protein [Aspergillus japonicus CBS 114.51]RAH81722.1 ketoacyl-synt-domain-containing protein [Aspergillus japonicus CBS 114.51]
MSIMEDPIAVVGFSLKFPQDADSSDGFWNMLHEGRCAMTEFPADRFNMDTFEGPKGASNGTMPLRGGHFLKEDLGVFDAPFFNVTPAEAEAMDPQQRLLLETSYRALENAGVTISRCAGSKTSVYTATFTDDYKSVLMDAPDNIPKYAATGLSGSMLANRISWFYDFRGPSMNLDSACSSSLSALHIACQDLHIGTSTMALVGGCNLVFHPDFMLIMSNMGFLSTDSRCQSFDHKANGYARGDGIGASSSRTQVWSASTLRSIPRGFISGSQQRLFHGQALACDGLVYVNSFGFGGSNAVVILDDALHYLAQNGLDGHHRTTDLTTYPTKILSRGTTEAPPPRLLVWSAADETSLRKLLRDPDARVDEPEYSQTYSTALQIAVVDFFMHVGAVPSAVVGHSSGEIAAAYCAGAIGDRTALRIAFHRGRLAQRLPQMHAVPQGMLAAAVSEEQVQPYVDRLGRVVDQRRVQIGCVNSPTSITLTGDKDQLEMLRSWLEKDGHFARMLRVNVAYHSTFMESIKDDYLAALRDMDGDPVGEPRVPMISTVTGQVVPPRMLRDPVYWVRNMVSRVRFATGIALLAVLSGRAPRKHLGSKFQSLSGITTLLEIGPHSTLQGPLRDIVKELEVQRQVTYDHALDRKTDAGKGVLECIGRLWSQGHSIDLRRANGLSDQSLVVRTDLPEYTFNHTHRHWFEDRLSSAFRFRTHGPHELLGIRTVDSNAYEARWRNILRLEDLPWLEDHQISDSILFPAAGMLAMAIQAAQQLASARQDEKVFGFELREIWFLNALQVPESAQGVETQVTLSHAGHRGGTHDATWYTFKVFTFTPRRECVEHAHGTIRVDMARVDQPDHTSAPWAHHQQTVKQIRETCDTALESEMLYGNIRENGVSYGPKFQTLENLRIDRRGRAVADIHPWSGKSDFPRQSSYVMHPATMDGLLQLVFPALNEGGSRSLPAMVPSYVKRLAIAAARRGQSDAAGDQPLLATTRSSMHGYNGTQSDVVALSRLDGQVVCAIDGYQTKFVASINDESVAERAARPLHSQVVWLPDLDLMTNEQTRLFCAQSQQQDSGDRQKLVPDCLTRFASLLTH